MGYPLSPWLLLMEVQEVRELRNRSVLGCFCGAGGSEAYLRGFPWPLAGESCSPQVPASGQAEARWGLPQACYQVSSGSATELLLGPVRRR